MKNIGYITLLFSIFFISCHHRSAPESLLNAKASLPEIFKLSDLHLKVLTSIINKKDSTTSLLYGDTSAEKMLTGGDAAKEGNFLLVTWRQQPDLHWFGAKIPGDLLFAEQLKKDKADQQFAYQKFTGRNLEKTADTTGAAARVKFILSQKVSVIP